MFSSIRKEKKQVVISLPPWENLRHYRVTKSNCLRNMHSKQLVWVTLTFGSCNLDSRVGGTFTLSVIAAVFYFLDL